MDHFLDVNHFNRYTIVNLNPQDPNQEMSFEH
jgi:hypothetical protein